MALVRCAAGLATAPPSTRLAAPAQECVAAAQAAAAATSVQAAAAVLLAQLLDALPRLRNDKCV